jgi:hypothetical protein
VRELLTFAMLISLGGADPQAKGHLAVNLNVGNTRQQLLDVITVLVPFIGYPRSLNARRHQGLSPTARKKASQGDMHLADHRGSATDSAVSLTAHLLQRGDNAVFAVRKGDDAVALPVAGLTALRILTAGPGPPRPPGDLRDWDLQISPVLTIVA